MAILPQEKYSDDKIEKLLGFLQKNFERGEPIQYEILVDRLKVVKRTSNPDQFKDFEDFVDGNTKSIEIIFYQGSSAHYDKRIFCFGEERKEQGLSGIEVETKIQEGISREIEKREIRDLKDKNKELKDEVAELESEVEKLEKFIEDAKAQESPLKGFLGEIGSTMVESFIRRNPQMLASIPGGQALAGFIEADNKRIQQGEPSEPEMEVSFRASEKKNSSEAKEALGFINYLKEKLNKDQFEKLMEIIRILCESGEKIDSVLNQLKG
jgi:hypothetical protein